jgi:hypothetical protein
MLTKAGVWALFAGFLLTIAFAPNTAQTENCDVDLRLAASLLIQAQDEASRGQTDRALRTLDLVSAEINAIRGQCGHYAVSSSDDTPVQSASIDLTQTYASNDSLYRFDYPAGWIIDDVNLSNMLGVELNGVIIASSQSALDSWQTTTFEAPEGEQAMAVIIADSKVAENFGFETASNLDEMASILSDFWSFALQIEMVEPTNLTINDRRAILIAGESETLVASIALIDLENGTFAVVAGNAATGDLDQFKSLVVQVADSILFLDNEPSGSLELSATYTFEASGVSFDYPAELLSSDSGGVYDFLGENVVFGSSESALANATSVAPEIQSGEYAVAVIIGNFDVGLDFLGVTSEIDPEVAFNLLIDFFEENLGTETIRAPARLASNPDLIETILSIGKADGIYVALLLGEGRYALVGGSSAPGEMDALEPIIIAIAESIRETSQ